MISKLQNLNSEPASSPGKNYTKPPGIGIVFPTASTAEKR